MSDTKASGWAGWGVFASVLLYIVGGIEVLYGLAAIIGPNSAYFLTVTGNLFLFDVAGWGWWHLILGAFLVLLGIALYRGVTWARVVTVILVSLNAISQLALLPVQPWWSLIVIALDVVIIFALTVKGRELKAAYQGPNG